MFSIFILILTETHYRLTAHYLTASGKTLWVPPSVPGATACNLGTLCSQLKGDGAQVHVSVISLT